MANPVTIRMAVVGVTLIPASTPSATGQGHLHLIIDADPPPAGQAVPSDDTHLHLGNGLSDITLQKPLAPGVHRITAVLADSSHIVTNPPLTDQISITVQNAAQAPAPAATGLTPTASPKSYP